MRRGRQYLAGLLFTLIAGSVTYAGIEGKWEKAQKADSVESYSRFLKKYPDSQYTQLAHQAIEDFHFKNAQSKRSLSAYMNFLSKYPEGSNAAEARKYIDAVSSENDRRFALLTSYGVGMTTLDSFQRDGWNAGDTARMKIGILSVEGDNASRAYKLGYSYLDSEIEAQTMQELYSGMLSFAKNKDTVVNFNTRTFAGGRGSAEVPPRVVCVLVFENLVLNRATCADGWRED